MPVSIHQVRCRSGWAFDERRFTGPWRPMKQQLAHPRLRGRRGRMPHAVWNESFPRIIEDIPRRLPRGAGPAIGQGSKKLFDFLFPGGLFAPAPWTSYFIAAVFAAVFIELVTSFLKFITQEPMSKEDIERMERELRQRDRLASMQQAAEETAAELRRQARLEERVALIRERRRRDARQARSSVSRAPGMVPPQEDLEQERFILRDFIVEERWRGLSWLSVATLFAIWCTGILNKDTALAP